MDRAVVRLWRKQRAQRLFHTELTEKHAGNEEGARIAEAGGMSVVMDRCIKVEHARYAGRMHWLGFNTQEDYRAALADAGLPQ